MMVPAMRPSLVLPPPVSPREPASAGRTSPSPLSAFTVPSSLSDDDPLLKAAKRGHTTVLQSLLSPLPASLLTAYLNTSDRSGSTAIFHAASHSHSHALSLLLAFGADPNHQNAQHNTAMHLACAKGYDGIVLILLSHDASPHLINCHGQRCYEMGNADRREKLRMETLVKALWHDLRKAKEDLAESAKAQSEAQEEKRGGGDAAVKRPSLGEVSRASQTGGMEDVRGRVSAGEAPLLAAALRYTEAETERERTQDRTHGEQSRTRALSDRSLILHLERRHTAQRDALHQRRLLRQAARQPTEEGQRLHAQLKLEQSQRWEAERARREAMRPSHERTAEQHRRMRREEETARVHEIRAVLKASDSPAAKGKSERLLRQLKHNTTWMITERERQLAKAAEAERRRRRRTAPTASDAVVFMTELEGQDSDPLPQPAQAEEVKEATAEAPRRVVEDDPRYFPPVEVKRHTREYLERILTEQFTMIPPPHSLQPSDIVCPTQAVPPPVAPTARGPSAVGVKAADVSNPPPVWRDVGWTVAGEEKAEVKAEVKGRRRGKAVARAAHGPNRAEVQRAEEEGERREQALLSALIMDEIHRTMRAQQRRALHTDDDGYGERRHAIEQTMPDLDPSSSLFHALVSAPRTFPVLDDAVEPRGPSPPSMDGLLPTDDALSTLMAKHSLHHL